MATVMRLAAVVLCAVVLCASMAAPAVASRKMNEGVVSFANRAVCIPATESLLEEHEGRHSCAYNLPNGNRAVGVGYNLDEDKERRRSELSSVHADYEKVYHGKDCLNNGQINALLALDTRRALDTAANHVKSLDDLCCDVMAVFGDVQHSGGRDAFEGNSFDDFIEAVRAKHWEKAAEEFEKTRWCSKNKKRCAHNRKIVAKGCGRSSTAASLAQVTDWSVA